MLSDADARLLLSMQAQDNEVFEDIITRMYVILLERGDTCLDGGASMGLHTVRLARIVGPEGTVFAIEPEPSSAGELEMLLRSRALENVRLVRRALYHKRQLTGFTVVKNVPTRSHIRTESFPASDSDVEEIEVATVLIDDLVRGIESWRFCKLDLEGGEFRALQGGHRAISRYLPFIVFERSMAAAGWYDYSPREFFEFFDSISYSLYDLFGRPFRIVDWAAPDRPWYAIGVRSASEDEAFVRERLPDLLREELTSERSPITASSPPPTGGGAFIWAAPNPVPSGAGLGSTVVHWDTGDGSIGEVYFSVNWDAERLFFRGSHGFRAAPWIHPACNYEFRLYRGKERDELLGAVTVRRRREPVDRRAGPRAPISES